jgi:Na+:H+ antiporter, NhaA family
MAIVLGAIAGIGFTISLFIGQLAFTDAASLAAPKLGVLAGSASPAIFGILLVGYYLRRVAGVVLRAHLTLHTP